MEKLHVNDKIKDLGTKGEVYIKDLLISRGYISYKSNLRKWNFEIDLLVYKVIPEKHVLEVRAVEVKTRSDRRAMYSLENFNIDQKLLKYRYFMFNIGQEIQRTTKTEGWYFRYHLDLAIVGKEEKTNELGEKSLYLQKYIQNVNLLI
ncbi:MAG: hypothetical protein RJB39_277 [Candidatus Parcubacteria bacterium]|jgi:Holliday junction resolvase-like predicted endonuclease